MSGIKAKTVVKYAVLPGIIPRLKGLFTSGFGYIAFLMAQIYAMVRLLPNDHPYLNPQNVGRYGIRHVIAESANALVVSKNNIDQLIVFVLMLTGVVLLAVQLIVLLFTLMFGTAMAASIFVTPNPDLDIAYMLLDQVFGVGNGAANFFNSCVSSAVLCPNETVNPPFPWPFHLALQNMFRFYSLGILVIGTIIFIYFLVVVVVETATTGTPFGQRFQNIWVPIRLVMAIGLLIPLNFGYNAGQYITFGAAKFGSSLATNGWFRYNDAIETSLGAGQGNPLGERENLIARPKAPDAAPIAEMMSLIHTCAFAHYFYNPIISKNGPIPLPITDPRQVRIDYPEVPGWIAVYSVHPNLIRPYFVKTPADWQVALGGLAADEMLWVNPATTYEQAMEFFTGGDIVIRFGRSFDTNGNGVIDPAEQAAAPDQTGGIEPTCGEVKIPITDRRITNPVSNVHATDGYLGTVATQRFYYNTIRDLWNDWPTSENYVDFAGRTVLKRANSEDVDPCLMGCAGALGVNPNLPGGGCGAAPASAATDNRACSTAEIRARWKQNAINTLQTQLDLNRNAIWILYNQQQTTFNVDPALLERGWGGAGIWFNRIAQVNGAFISSWLDVPTLVKYPKVMEDILSQRLANDASVSGIDKFSPNIAKTSEGTQSTDGNSEIATGPIAGALHQVYTYWHLDAENMATTEKIVKPGALETGMNLVFGTYGLFAMQGQDVHTHPLVQLTALGKGLVESAVRNVAGATTTAAMGGFIGAIEKQSGSGAGLGSAISGLSGLMLSTAFVGLTAGIVLFYVLPFLPFVYFYFAVGQWVKSIFEAMVGVPLWALAHLRLDGDGLPGDSAANGYFLIFEIFARPILTVFGLVASMIIFTAQVRILNFIWLLVTQNVGGFDDPTINVATIEFKRSIVDEFFFTVVYAIIVYMIATASFKLIDKIPDNILRWMGQGVSSFGDINEDPTQSLTKYAALGGLTAGRQTAEGITTLSGGLGSSLGQLGGGVGKIVR